MERPPFAGVSVLYEAGLEVVSYELEGDPLSGFQRKGPLAWLPDAYGERVIIKPSDGDYAAWLWNPVALHGMEAVLRSLGR